MTGPDLIPVVLAENCDRRQWVGTRTTSLQVRRRKAAVGVSLPGSSPWSLSADDPKRKFTHVRSGHSPLEVGVAAQGY